MKPLWIFQHESWIGAGHLEDVLKSQNIAREYFDIDAGDPIPEHLSDDVAGLVFLGGTMSANDRLPWIDKELALIRQAERAGRPVMGHCLGSQLISRALGGTVSAMTNKEIGWHRVQRENNPVAEAWFSGLSEGQPVLAWHHDEFSIPPGATRLFQSEFCRDHAFARGNILATVAHIELNAQMLREWLAIYGHDIVSIDNCGSVQPKEEIRRDLDVKMRTMHKLSDVFYSRWLKMAYPDAQIDLQKPVDANV